jgi:hypothetical protein
MLITLDDVRAARLDGAPLCQDGLTEFEKFFPNGADVRGGLLVMSYERPFIHSIRWLAEAMKLTYSFVYRRSVHWLATDPGKTGRRLDFVDGVFVGDAYCDYGSLLSVYEGGAGERC